MGFRVWGSGSRLSCFVFRVSCFVFRMTGRSPLTRARQKGWKRGTPGAQTRSVGLQCSVVLVRGLAVRVEGLWAGLGVEGLGVGGAVWG